MVRSYQAILVRPIVSESYRRFPLAYRFSVESMFVGLVQIFKPSHSHLGYKKEILLS
jgi:hypothetical protein